VLYDTIPDEHFGDSGKRLAVLAVCLHTWFHVQN